MNRLIVATGGTKGIGLAILEKFAQAGFDVATCSRTLVDLQGVKAGLEKNYSVRVFIHTADLSVSSQVKALSEFVTGLNRPVDVLVNNAGVAGFGLLEAYTVDQVRRMFEVNFYGVLRTYQAVLPGMRKQNGGLIINITTGASTSPCIAVLQPSKSRAAKVESVRRSTNTK